MEKPDVQKVKLGVIGLGGRAKGLLRNLLDMNDVEIPAICDLSDERLQQGNELVKSSGRPKAKEYKAYEQLLDRKDIEGVIIPSDWINHVKIAVAAMKAGKYASCEVGAVASLNECWELVKTSEETGIPCMLLENCNYGRDEMAILNMVKQGVFGEIIHCQAGYEHDLRKSLAMGIENKHYRIHHYLNRNGDNYPTHGLGPIAKCLNINRGNQFLTLTSMSSKSKGLREWSAENLGKEHAMAHTDYAQGDIVTTMIKCAHGETILLTLDTTLPRPYSRAGRVQGTQGLWTEDNNSIHIQGRSPEHTWESFDTYREEFEHPLWKEYIQQGVRGGHGGMDYLCLRAFVESIANKTTPPIDVYDAVAWMSVSTLSEQSIAQGGQPVSFPDFTNGKWINRESAPKSKYSLNEVNKFLFV